MTLEEQINQARTEGWVDVKIATHPPNAQFEDALFGKGLHRIEQYRFKDTARIAETQSHDRLRLTPKETRSLNASNVYATIQTTPNGLYYAPHTQQAKESKVILYKENNEGRQTTLLSTQPKHIISFHDIKHREDKDLYDETATLLFDTPHNDQNLQRFDFQYIPHNDTNIAVFGTPRLYRVKNEE
jgi:hypothetical protein